MSIQSPQQVMLPIGSLKMSEYNPRDMSTEEMSRLKRSIEEFGFLQPVVARSSDGLIIGGHQRVAAIKELLKDKGVSEEAIAIEQIPVIGIDISDDKAKLLNLALNKISGDWNYAKLADLINSLQIEGADVALSGFSPGEIEELQKLSSLAAGEALNSMPPPDVDVDDVLREKMCKFNFEVNTPEEAILCNEVLRRYGMTGPRNIGDAFVKMCKAAASALDLIGGDAGYDPTAEEGEPHV